ncbi:MAG TPA: retropepsin-like aspartic protease, partial [Arenimonas sp.]|nr:retropepsin-like aspartic protease [Arenimonas sp.]
DYSKLNTKLVLEPKQEFIISMQSTGVQSNEFKIFMRTKDYSPAIPEQVISGGDMELHRAKDGHYYIQGSINGNPITFLVDTGATVTTLQQNTAIIGGIKDCQATQSNTANGIVDVCVGTIAEMQIGEYIINNAVVVSNPKIGVNLLGMNVLGQFKIRTENGVMYLSK